MKERKIVWLLFFVEIIIVYFHPSLFFRVQWHKRRPRNLFWCGSILNFCGQKCALLDTWYLFWLLLVLQPRNLSPGKGKSIKFGAQFGVRNVRIGGGITNQIKNKKIRTYISYFSWCKAAKGAIFFHVFNWSQMGESHQKSYFHMPIQLWIIIFIFIKYNKIAAKPQNISWL